MAELLLLSFVLPWTSSLLRSYAWITILPTGLLNTVLTSLGLPALELLNRSPAVLIGMSYSLLPMVLILYASLKTRPAVAGAAADLSSQAFWKVTVPQTLPGIAAGFITGVYFGVRDFVDPELLGGASSMTAARDLQPVLGATQNWGLDRL